jgi:hypothetical protein
MIFPFFAPAGPLSFQRMRPVVAKNRSSLGPQSIHHGIMTGIGKNRRGASTNPPGLIPAPKNCATVSAGVAIQNFRAQREPLHSGYFPYTATTEKSQNLKSTERLCFLGRGIPEMYRRKPLESTVQKSGRIVMKGRGDILRERNKSTSQSQYPDFPVDIHSAVLKDWSCDSSEAQYSRSETSSA